MIRLVIRIQTILNIVQWNIDSGRQIWSWKKIYGRVFIDSTKSTFPPVFGLKRFYFHVKYIYPRKLHSIFQWGHSCWLPSCYSVSSFPALTGTWSLEQSVAISITGLPWVYRQVPPGKEVLLFQKMDILCKLFIVYIFEYLKKTQKKLVYSNFCYSKTH